MIIQAWKRLPLAVKLTVIITFIVVLVVAMLTTLSVRRERQTFQRELEQQAKLLLDTLSASSADSLYFLDGDFLADLMENMGKFEVVTFGRIYDADGRVVADALNPDARFTISPDPFGQQLLQSEGAIFDWRTDQLIAGQAVQVGAQRIGAVSVGLPTAPLKAKLDYLGQQVTIVAFIVILVGMTLALLFSRSITDPLQDMIKATQRIQGGDLSYRLQTASGDELAQLASHFNEMTDQLAQTLNQMEAEIEERKRTQAALELAKEAAETANRAKSTFLANMSHELRTPLNAILGFSELMARDQAIANQHYENLQAISRSGEHLLSLINQVLDMSKIEAGRMTVSERDFDLYRLLADLEMMFHLKAQENRVRLIVERHPEVPQHIRADEIKLRQILINLLNNAFKFTKEGYVMLRVDCRRETAVSHPPLTHTLMFTVEDTGPGIEPDELGHLFDAFAQTKTGRDLGGGTGLGLSLSRQFAQLLGGDLTARNVRDEVGFGAIFQFQILVRLVEGSFSTGYPQQPNQIVALEAGQPDYRLLIVDDNYDNRLVLARLLAPLGFAIRQAENGKQAVEQWQAWRPHLIWMDLHMPEMDGLTASRRIKAHPDSQETIIIATTATAFTVNIEDITKSGCNDFIRKPAQANEIFEVLQRHLGVRYVYGAQGNQRYTAVSPLAQSSDAALSEAIAQLPPGLIVGLQQAATQTNMTAVAHYLEQIQQQDPAVAEFLKNLADRFEYDKILTLVKAQKLTP